MGRTFPTKSLIRSEFQYSITYQKSKKNCLIDNQVTYGFFISNEFIDFSKSFFSIFSTLMKISILKKIQDYNRATVSSIIWKILVCDMEYRNKIYPKFVTLCSFFQITKKTFQKCNNFFFQIHTDFEKSIFVQNKKG